MCANELVSLPRIGHPLNQRLKRSPSNSRCCKVIIADAPVVKRPAAFRPLGITPDILAVGACLATLEPGSVSGPGALASGCT